MRERRDRLGVSFAERHARLLQRQRVHRLLDAGELVRRHGIFRAAPLDFGETAVVGFLEGLEGLHQFVDIAADPGLRFECVHHVSILVYGGGRLDERGQRRMLAGEIRASPSCPCPASRRDFRPSNPDAHQRPGIGAREPGFPHKPALELAFGRHRRRRTEWI